MQQQYSGSVIYNCVWINEILPNEAIFHALMIILHTAEFTLYNLSNDNMTIEMLWVHC